jgi:hypothetical protein
LQYLHSGCVADIYWTRTGSTELLERLIAGADGSIQQELISLLEGNSLALKKINQDVILLDLNRKKQEPWSFLFFAGYLTTTKHTFDANEHQYTLDIPNLEIALLYKTLVTNALSKGLSLHQLTELLKALMEGNLSVFSSLLTQLVVSLCSYHDLPSTTVETSLHLFVLGLLASLADRYLIKSNLESGDGRYDILMVPKNEGDFAILLEFKQGKERQLEKLAQEALLQMKTHRYEQQVRDLGYRGKILYYGIAVHRKQLVVKSYIDVLKDL